MNDALHGIEDDVPFDHGTANSLISFCEEASRTITNQLGARHVFSSVASADFKGYYSRLFTDNVSTARADAGELAARLDEVAEKATYLKQCAEAEQARREKARAWMQEREDRNWVHKRWDDLTGSEDDATPPVGPPDPPAPQQASPPRRGIRQTPPPGTGGGGGEGGTSSARPADLRSFATGNRNANQALTHLPGRLQGRLADFSSLCRWGTLEASGVVSGFTAWNAANDEDVAWATAVADAFAQAGGEGSVNAVANSAVLASLDAAGVDAARQDLTIEPGQAWGVAPTTGYAVDPVNTATGNFLETEHDLRFPGAGAGLHLERTYNSFDPGVGALGPGWSSWTEAGLTFDDEAARMRRPDGRTTVFPRLGETWDRAVGDSLWLEAADQGHVVRDNQGHWWRYSPTGHLAELTSGPAHGVVRLRWSGDRLVRLEHSRGHHIDLEWDERLDRVVGAVADDGRRVDYGYDAEGRLCAVTDALGTRRYDHDETGLVARVVDADGVVELDNEYDDQRRVVRQRTPHGRLVRLSYLPGRVTVVSDPDGTRSNTWIHDRSGRLVGVVDADERRQSMSYDDRGNLVATTERDGAVTVQEYDARGRRIRTVTPGGADITIGYDDLDRVTTLVAASGGVTEYVYDGEDREPVEVVDPEGGRLRLSWSDGLLVGCTDPTGVSVTMTYDVRGDLVSATDAVGNTARMERDATGRIVVAITPGGARTEMTYTDGGLPLTRRDPDGAVWRYEHTTAGRLAAVVDPTGGRTTVEHGAHGDAVRTIDPLGQAVSRTLDDLGNLASAELPDGSTWRYTHDALSRLVTVTDPTGAEWTREHDLTGTVTATVDPTGRRRTARSDRTTGQVTVDDGLVARTATVDSLGRLTATTQPDGSAALCVYDLCGRVVELVDPEGNLTRITRDAAGRPVTSTDPLGAVTRFEYDACGRLAATVAPGGGRTTRHHDAEGRVVRQTMPDGEVAWASYDVCGRVTALHRPGRGTARYAYDRAGRVRESSDPHLGHRRFTWDAASRLVAVTDGVGGVTRFDYDAVGRVASVTDPLGGVTRREYDAMGRCTAHTDPLGRTLSAGHDAAGRTLWEQDADGVRTAWTFDASGRWATRSVDGVPRAALDYDPRTRTMRLTEALDRPDAEGRDRVVHELEYDRRQLLVRRSRGGRSLRWEYDAAGRRTARIAPDGTRTDYGRDVDGRLVSVTQPDLGRVTLERDAAGRLVRSLAGDAVQSWSHRDGWVVAHTSTGPDGSHATTIERDEEGRITALVEDGRRTRLEHDAALRLVEQHTEAGVTTWRYDAAGRLVAETVGGLARTHSYDAAGQLLHTEETGTGADAGETTSTTYDYDGSGRRVRSRTSRGRARELGWSPEGRLASIVDHEPDSDDVRRVDLHVDALGELAGIDGAEVWWDTASGVPSLVQVGSESVTQAGPVTGVGSQWRTPGWRAARAGSDEDPWAVAETVPLPGGVSLGGAGELVILGLEWMGARAYDPAARGFLSVDPLPPVLGTGAAGNPYAFAGNDPLHALDPLGLRPATDADLDAFAAANAGTFAGAIKWVDENTDYIVGGLVTAAGVAAFFLPIPGAQILGGMLVGAGVNMISQRVHAGKDGEIDYVQVGIAGAFGAVGGAGTSVAIRMGVQGVMRQAVVGGTVMGASEGVVTGNYTYFTDDKPNTLGNYVNTVGGTTLETTVTGAVLGPLEAKIDASALRRLWPDYGPPTGGGLPDQTTIPHREVTIGNADDLGAARDLGGFHPAGNDSPGYASVRQAVEHQQPVYLASDAGADFGHNMDILRDAGYTRQGDYMVPPGG